MLFIMIKWKDLSLFYSLFYSIFSYVSRNEDKEVLIITGSKIQENQWDF